MGIDFIANIPRKGTSLSDLLSASDFDIFEVVLQVLQLKTPISEKELYLAAAELYGVETLNEDVLRALKRGTDLIPEDRYVKDGSRYYCAESLKEKSTLSLDLLDLDFEIEGAQEAKKKGVVDIIFVIDITGSMGPAIKQITHNISQFIENINPQDVKDWRVKVYSFGDLTCDPSSVAMNVNRPWISKGDDLNMLVAQFDECIKLVGFKGGGDEPESSLDAVYLAARDGFDTDWTERTRAVVLFTDATPKQIQKGTIGVNADGLQLLIQQINDGHTYLHMFAPKHNDYLRLKNGIGRFGNYVAVNEGGGSPVTALKEVDFAKVLETLGKSVSQASLIN